MKAFISLSIIVVGIAIGVYNFGFSDRGVGEGEVKGIAAVYAIETPKSKLPVEHYNGSPFVDSIGEMLKLLNVQIYPEDVLKAFPSPALGIGSHITIYRATPAIVDDAGTKTTYRTWQENVGQLIQEKAIELGDKDKLEPGLDTRLSPNIAITITRVEVAAVEKKELIPFKTVFKDDPNLDKGLTRIEQKGVSGQKVLIYEVTRENGKEVGRKLIKTDIVQESVTAITVRGTKEVIYGNGIATWFAAPGMIAAHNSLPRGTKVEVINTENGKSVTVEVIGGGIRSRAIIDLAPDAFAKLAPLSKGVVKVRLIKP